MIIDPDEVAFLYLHSNHSECKDLFLKIYKLQQVQHCLSQQGMQNYFQPRVGKDGWRSGSQQAAAVWKMMFISALQKYFGFRWFALFSKQCISEDGSSALFMTAFSVEILRGYELSGSLWNNSYTCILCISPH